MHRNVIRYQIRDRQKGSSLKYSLISEEKSTQAMHLAVRVLEVPWEINVLRLSMKGCSGKNRDSATVFIESSYASKGAIHYFQSI